MRDKLRSFVELLGKFCSDSIMAFSRMLYMCNIYAVFVVVWKRIFQHFHLKCSVLYNSHSDTKQHLYGGNLPVFDDLLCCYMVKCWEIYIWLHWWDNEREIRILHWNPWEMWFRFKYFLWDYIYSCSFVVLLFIIWQRETFGIILFFMSAT